MAWTDVEVVKWKMQDNSDPGGEEANLLQWDKFPKCANAKNIKIKEAVGFYSASRSDHSYSNKPLTGDYVLHS